jgi:hypothetical protein
MPYVIQLTEMTNCSTFPMWYPFYYKIGFLRMSIPNTCKSEPADRIKANEINHCLIIGAHATLLIFALTAINKIDATAKFSIT